MPFLKKKMYRIENFLNAPIYRGIVDSEIPKPAEYRCFPGAWYYKALSSRDYWLGFDGIVRLPEFIPDEKRYVDEADYRKYLDTPSVYVGGSSDFENDIGFGWLRGIINGKISQEKITYRPFWRYIYRDGHKIKNIYTGTKIEETEYYFFPGDEVRITVAALKEHFLVMRIDLVKATEIEHYRLIRSRLNQTPETLLSGLIPAPGTLIRHAEYKRVNAIDQYGNEGKPAQMTKARTAESVWRDVYLYRRFRGGLIRVPFTEERYIKMLCPRPEAIKVITEESRETVVIEP